MPFMLLTRIESDHPFWRLQHVIQYLMESQGVNIDVAVLSIIVQAQQNVTSEGNYPEVAR